MNSGEINEETIKPLSSSQETHQEPFERGPSAASASSFQNDEDRIKKASTLKSILKPSKEYIQDINPEESTAELDQDTSKKVEIEINEKSSVIKPVGSRSPKFSCKPKRERMIAYKQLFDKTAK